MFNIYEEYDPDYVIKIDGEIYVFDNDKEYNEFIRIKKIKRLKNKIDEVTVCRNKK